MIVDFIDFILEFFLWLTGKRSKKNREWTGRVVKKGTKSDYSVAKYKCYVLFETDEGKKIQIRMQESDFAGYELNKRYRKKAGDELPELAEVQY